MISGDRFVATAPESAALRALLPDALAVEMEGAALAQVCADFGAPFAVVRTVSDRADDSAHVDFNRFIAEVASVYTREIIGTWLDGRRRDERAAPSCRRRRCTGARARPAGRRGAPRAGAAPAARRARSTLFDGRGGEWAAEVAAHRPQRGAGAARRVRSRSIASWPLPVTLARRHAGQRPHGHAGREGLRTRRRARSSRWCANARCCAWPASARRRRWRTGRRWRSRGLRAERAHACCRRSRRCARWRDWLAAPAGAAGHAGDRCAGC